MNEIIKTPEGWNVLKTDSHLSRWIEQQKTLGVAENEMHLFERFIPVGGVVVDAGANLGDHTWSYAKRVGPLGMIFSFEPNPVVFEALRRNFEGQPNVTTTHCGLSDATTQAFIQTPTDNIGASYVTSGGTAGGVPVYCHALDDSLPKDLQRLDFIHLDVEGYELSALKGAKATLAKFKPAIVFEVNKGCLARVGSSEAEVRAWLADNGYFTQELEAHHGPHLEQRDLLATPIK